MKTPRKVQNTRNLTAKSEKKGAGTRRRRNARRQTETRRVKRRVVIWVKYRDSLDMKNNCGRFAHFHRNEMNEKREANAKRWMDG